MTADTRPAELSPQDQPDAATPDPAPLAWCGTGSVHERLMLELALQAALLDGLSRHRYGGPDRAGGRGAFRCTCGAPLRWDSTQPTLNEAMDAALHRHIALELAALTIPLAIAP